ncbi:hypothetical protein HMPREF0663_10524 [Hoylesella oralis ATCC 33269]|uniref:Uncharacterized protein n=1 Tax=Hoylesella oralis ATCC 33269 TaxID=873533 RepID=E7RN24_9BACT|nr:hypothetical protein HMPREF0663_10524 [Hoylesella oralis ATCC 33269]
MVRYNQRRTEKVKKDIFSVNYIQLFCCNLSIFATSDNNTKKDKSK